jgi:hypothetical protein
MCYEWRITRIYNRNFTCKIFLSFINKIFFVVHSKKILRSQIDIDFVLIHFISQGFQLTLHWQDFLSFDNQINLVFKRTLMYSAVYLFSVRCIPAIYNSIIFFLIPFIIHTKRWTGGRLIISWFVNISVIRFLDSWGCSSIIMSL